MMVRPLGAAACGWPKVPSALVMTGPALVAVMSSSLVFGRARGLATRKNTAQVNTIHFRDTMFTLQ
jgi:hypothetical protein